MSASKILCALPVGCLLVLVPAPPAHAVSVSVTNLVSDDATAYPAKITDPSLINAWGISSSATSPFWVSAADGGVSTVYSVNPLTQQPTKIPLTVTVPGSPTGQVFNGGSGFNGDVFLFVGEDGTISGWRGALGTNAEILVSPSAASYKGAALSVIGSDRYLLAADFAGGKIDVLKGNAASPNIAGNFSDPGLPSGYAPFNIQQLGGKIYVTYALKGPDEEETGPGLGMVDSYDLSGNFLARIATAGALNAPWGLAIAPGSFGDLAGSLLVGNFGDGRISAFDLATNTFLGQLLDPIGSPLEIEGLWGLAVGNGVNGGSTKALYFTAGPDGESHGLFGVLQPLPEPASWALMVAGLGAVGWSMRRRKVETRVRFA